MGRFMAEPASDPSDLLRRAGDGSLTGPLIWDGTLLAE
jgi:hypothetical protein